MLGRALCPPVSQRTSCFCHLPVCSRSLCTLPTAWLLMWLGSGLGSREGAKPCASVTPRAFTCQRGPCASAAGGWDPKGDEPEEPPAEQGWWRRSWWAPHRLRARPGSRLGRPRVRAESRLCVPPSGCSSAISASRCLCLDPGLSGARPFSFRACRGLSAGKVTGGEGTRMSFLTPPLGLCPKGRRVTVRSPEAPAGHRLCFIWTAGYLLSTYCMLDAVARAGWGAPYMDGVTSTEKPDVLGAGAQRMSVWACTVAHAQWTKFCQGSSLGTCRSRGGRAGIGPQQLGGLTLCRETPSVQPPGGSPWCHTRFPGPLLGSPPGQPQPCAHFSSESHLSGPPRLVGRCHPQTRPRRLGRGRVRVP